MRILIALIAILAAPLGSQATAQDRAGNDTPGEWVVTHHTPFGLWDSFCDERTTGETLEQRCYLRYVEVYAPRPNFGAIFTFITPDEVEFGMESGIRLIGDGLRIEQDGEIAWQETRRSCQTGGACTLDGGAADAFLDTASDGGTLAITLRDRQGIVREMFWDLSQMDAALTDYRAEAQKRDLLPG
ncbi:MAG: hypothetical protein AAFO93_16005 [Pseudomonadota bacterium]